MAAHPALIKRPVAEDGKNWRSSLWPMKRERITLIPGDSPMGLRLPLNDLPQLAKKADRVTPQRDPFEPRDALVKRKDMQFADTADTPEDQLPDPDDYEAVVRTALVGQRSPRPGAGLQPFRLDMGPRIYREVTQRIF